MTDVRSGAHHGIIAGIAAGLIITFFDGAFMLWMHVFVPSAYPFILIAFNIIFWGGVGCLLGWFSCWARGKRLFGVSDPLCWVVFFLAPLIMLYGVLGRIPIPHVVTMKYLWETLPPFDSHLSFLWTAFIIVAAGVYVQRHKDAHQTLPLLLMVDFFFAAMLFHFCSNLNFIIFQNTIARHVSKGLYAAVGVSFSNILVYSIGVCCIFGLYGLAISAIKPVARRVLVRPYVVLCVVWLCVCASLYVFYNAGPRPSVNAAQLAGSTTPAGTDQRAPVIVLILDAVRADRLSVYNSSLTTSQHLKRFAEDALVFDRCIAPASWTLPSHASLFTGLYTSEHRCTLGATSRPTIPASSVTLAEIFAHTGYTTGAVFSNAWLNSVIGYDRGFQVFDARASLGKQQKCPFRPFLTVVSYVTNYYSKIILPFRIADDININVKKTLDALSPGPFFLCVNYMDAHVPYLPPRPFCNCCTSNGMRRLDGMMLFFSKIRTIRDAAAAAAFYRSPAKTQWDAFNTSQYDGSISYLDHKLGELFAFLKASGVYDRALIIVTSDHGDMLGRHDLYGHRCELYEGVVRIPLIIKFPHSSRRGYDKRFINLTDLFATILTICGIDVPDDVSAEAFGGERSVVSEYYSGDGLKRAVYDGVYKYMACVADCPESCLPELYDLGKDPFETVNLAVKKPKVAARMAEKLADWERGVRTQYIQQEENGPVSDSLKQTMRALGYVQ